MKHRVVVDVHTLGETALKMGVAFVEGIARNFEPYGPLKMMIDIPPWHKLVCMKMSEIRSQGLSRFEHKVGNCSECGVEIGFSPFFSGDTKKVCPDCFARQTGA